MSNLRRGERVTVSAAEALAAPARVLRRRVCLRHLRDTNIALLDAISRDRIKFVIARHEQTAAHAADGYARASGKPGVLLLHVGPGMMNAVTGVATAALDRSRWSRSPETCRATTRAGTPTRKSTCMGRRPDRHLPAVQQADLARARRRGPAPVHRARVLDGDHRPPGRGPAQRPDGHLLQASPRRVGQPVPLPARDGAAALEPGTAAQIAELPIAAERRSSTWAAACARPGPQGAARAG